nr:immunoglobulin heavy chain junction region [Macaca mulatta]MOV87105.1 immunoglobulin heavy chain junction region [Macaca mulatta]MOV87265.1 immunoglobulin heavy chain junction region [Macaca mulatta]MOV87611.1 immunoglobulin heavy chain junction region [Macaca mulatta]MOV87704.1 immunoglobulin heavy chain junction region [Macaca mulatta]
CVRDHWGSGLDYW